jgi:hypothetical protein
MQVSLGVEGPVGKEEGDQVEANQIACGIIKPNILGTWVSRRNFTISRTRIPTLDGV